MAYSKYFEASSFLFCPLCANRNEINTSPITIGETREIKSDILKENRILNILPASYSTESTKKYPVIYLLDGSIDEDFIHIAVVNLDLFLDR
jgi:enterochelin esterase-like enzyme